MRIALMSDLHCDLEKVRPSLSGHPDRGPNLSKLKEAGADVLVLAGNIEVGPMMLADYVCQVYQYLRIPIVCVMGNHEFYKGEMHQTLGDAYDRFRRARQRGYEVHLLERTGVAIAGVHFLGATLWTDFGIHGPEHIEEAMIEARRTEQDFKQIRYGSHRLDPITYLGLHRKTVKWLEEGLEKKRLEPTVVVTHHGPARGSITERYREDILTATYVSDLEGLIRRYQPKAWLHGHVHCNVNYKIEGTSILANPRGLPTGFSAMGQENPHFNSAFLIPIDGAVSDGGAPTHHSGLRVIMQNGSPIERPTPSPIPSAQTYLKSSLACCGFCGRLVKLTPSSFRTP